MDLYESEWADTLSESKMTKFIDGKPHKYIRKTSEAVSDNSFSPSDHGPKKRYQVKQSSEPKKPKTSANDVPGAKKNTLQSLLSALGPEEKDEFVEKSDDEDEELMKMEKRRVSMNVDNVVGMNFEKYRDEEPPEGFKVSDLF